MGGLFKEVGKLFGFDQSAITNASKQQAAATRVAASESLNQSNQIAQENAATAQATTNQRAASQAAADLLASQTPATPTVTANTDDEDTDPITGATRSTRSAFFSSNAGSTSAGAGINLGA